MLQFVLLPLTEAVYATNVPPGPLGTGTPARYGLTYQDVAFRAADGVRLSAWYIPSRNGAAVVLLAGSGSTRTAVLGQAAVLARQPGVQAGKIAELGESMGGEQALAAMGADPRIRAVVAEGVEGQQYADRGWRLQDITGVIDRGVDWVQYTAAGLISGAPRPMSIPDAIRAAALRPVLIVAGGTVASEPVAARWFRAASPATVQVWVVPHAGTELTYH